MSQVSLSVNRQLEATLPEHKLFKIDANNCNLRVGDHVVAETTVGTDFASGDERQVGCKGVVEAVNWSADEHALFVWVRVLKEKQSFQ